MMESVINTCQHQCRVAPSHIFDMCSVELGAHSLWTKTWRSRYGDDEIHLKWAKLSLCRSQDGASEICYTVPYNVSERVSDYLSWIPSLLSCGGSHHELTIDQIWLLTWTISVVHVLDFMHSNIGSYFLTVYFMIISIKIYPM